MTAHGWNNQWCRQTSGGPPWLQRPSQHCSHRPDVETKKRFHGKRMFAAHSNISSSENEGAVSRLQEDVGISPFFNGPKKRKDSWSMSTSGRLGCLFFDHSDSFNLDIFSLPSRCPAVKTSSTTLPRCVERFLFIKHSFFPLRGPLDPFSHKLGFLMQICTFVSCE